MTKVFIVLNTRFTNRELLMDGNKIYRAVGYKEYTEVIYCGQTYEVRQSPSEILALIRKEEKRDA